VASGGDHHLNDAGAAGDGSGHSFVQIDLRRLDHPIQPLGPLSQPRLVPEQHAPDLRLLVGGQHVPDVVDGQVDPAQCADQPSLSDLAGMVAAVRRARVHLGRFQYTHVVVVSQRRHGQPADRREPTDLQQLIVHASIIKSLAA
jgi:hypothetical protein